ncbi:MAG: thioredoxin family protein [Mariprofundus sp.]|nr:thioredoxin family protein [Mariprofundus sp.]
MALVGSIHVDIGWQLPDLTLMDVDERLMSLHSQMGEHGLLVAFTCNHCPYAVAVWPRLIRHAAAIREMGVHTVAVNPNIHPDYPADSLGAMQQKKIEWAIDFPYLADDTQSAAKLFEAQCTPDIYLFDANGGLFYHGRIDDDWKDESNVMCNELMDAIERLVAGDTPPQPQYPTIGCSIKWLDEINDSD